MNARNYVFHGDQNSVSEKMIQRKVSRNEVRRNCIILAGEQKLKAEKIGKSTTQQGTMGF